MSKLILLLSQHFNLHVEIPAPDITITFLPEQK